MLKRKIEADLQKWKNTKNRKPLIIKGCRQCGKTYSVLDFAKKNYENVRLYGTLYGSNPLKKADLPFI